ARCGGDAERGVQGADGPLRRVGGDWRDLLAGACGTQEREVTPWRLWHRAFSDPVLNLHPFVRSEQESSLLNRRSAPPPARPRTGTGCPKGGSSVTGLPPSG